MASSPAEEGENLDSVFQSFLSEVDSLPKANARKKQSASVGVVGNVLASFGLGEDECERLTLQMFSNGFEVLRLSPEATDDEIKKQYRKLSLLVHPDKCQHPKAEEAFHTVNKAYEELQLPEYKEKYRKVIAEAKRRALLERKKENKKLINRGEPPLPETDDSIQSRVAELCDSLLKELEERQEYAEKTRKANEEREKQQQEQEEADEKSRMEAKRKFAEMRDTRVGSWRGFQSKVQSKEVKLAAFQPHKPKKEQRTYQKEPDSSATEAKKRKIALGIDESYKETWR